MGKSDGEEIFCPVGPVPPVHVHRLVPRQSGTCRFTSLSPQPPICSCFTHVYRNLRHWRNLDEYRKPFLKRAKRNANKLPGKSQKISRHRRTVRILGSKFTLNMIRALRGRLGCSLVIDGCLIGLKRIQKPSVRCRIGSRNSQPVFFKRKGIRDIPRIFRLRPYPSPAQIRRQKQLGMELIDNSGLKPFIGTPSRKGSLR